MSAPLKGILLLQDIYEKGGIVKEALLYHLSTIKLKVTNPSMECYFTQKYNTFRTSLLLSAVPETRKHSREAERQHEKQQKAKNCSAGILFNATHTLVRACCEVLIEVLFLKKYQTVITALPSMMCSSTR